MHLPVVSGLVEIYPHSDRPYYHHQKIFIGDGMKDRPPPIEPHTGEMLRLAALIATGSPRKGLPSHTRSEVDIARRRLVLWLCATPRIEGGGTVGQRRLALLTGMSRSSVSMTLNGMKKHPGSAAASLKRIQARIKALLECRSDEWRGAEDWLPPLRNGDAVNAYRSLRKGPGMGRPAK
jgi:hypothetical protein